MTAITDFYKTKAKVEISGVTTTTVAIIVDDNSTAVIGETLIGRTSNASGKVYGIATIDLKDAILLKERSGFFAYEEIIDGTVSGLAMANTDGVQTYYTSEYTNSELGVTAGEWIIETTGDLTLKLSDSVRRINISEGGNFATGYTFGFSLLNFDLARQIIEDGVFLQNLDVKYYIDFGYGNGYVQVWTGIMDTFPKTASTSMDFTCIDSMKRYSNKIGSEKIPIALNLNQNCKLVEYEEGIQDISYTYYELDDILRRYGVVKNKDVLPYLDGGLIKYTKLPASLNSIVIYAFYDGAWLNAIENNQGLTITVTGGPDAQKSYNVVNYERAGTLTFGGTPISEMIVLYLDGSNSGISIEGSPNGTSLIELSTNYKDYRFSENAVNDVFVNNTSSTQTVRTYDDDELKYFKNGRDFTVFNPRVRVKGFNDSNEFLSKEDHEINTSSFTHVTSYKKPTGQLIIESTVSISANSLLNVSLDSDSVYINLDDIRVVLTGAGYTSASTKMSIHGRAYYKKSELDDSTTPINLFDSDVHCETGISGADVNIYPKIGDTQIQFNGFYDGSVYSNVSIYVNLKIQGSTTNSEAQISWVYFNNLRYVNTASVKLGDMGGGCMGENVSQTDGTNDSYPETIKYLETEYGNVDISEINELSYTQAEEEYQNFPAVSVRNPAHQIIKQTDLNVIIKDLLYFGNLGLFPNRLGKRTLVNFLWKSSVFSQSQPIDQYSNFKKISPITRSPLSNVASDFELEYNYSEAEDKFISTMRVKNTDSDFNFDTSLENVPEAFKAEGNEAFNLAFVGEKRIKKQSKTKVSSKWIKSDSEAINFILNQLGHINRGHERITITRHLNPHDSVKELLDYDLVNGNKITDNQDRKGWVEQIRISWIRKEISFTYFLDINDKDPFYYDIGIIQDTPSDSVDVYNVDPDSEEILQDTGY